MDNVVFLDYDGVINLDSNNFGKDFIDREPIDNLNRFCIDNNFKIVVISSWRKYPDYKELLFNSRLDEKVQILGKTNILSKEREIEIIDYLENNPYINKFIMLDDGEYNELSKYQVKTEFREGFNKEKYEEAINMIKCK